MRSSLSELWARFICIASVTALFVVILWTLVEIDGWLKYETGRQLATEIGVRVIIGLVLAGCCAALAGLLSLPYVLCSRTHSAAPHQKVLQLAMLLALTICASAVLGMLIVWSVKVGLVTLMSREAIHLWAWLSGVLLLCSATLFVAGRVDWVDTYSQSLSGRTTRRFLILAGIGALATGLSTEPDRRPAASRARMPKVRPTSPNIVLVTFDALSAEDMSCYGYGLPTTPNVDLLAKSSYVFSNYYAASTFTTPCIASMLTGCYPSSTHVYQYGGSLRGAAADRTLPGVLHSYGYATAASVGNPGAHPACMGFAGDFDFLPVPALTDFATRETASLFRSAQLASDVGLAADFFPQLLGRLSPGTFSQSHSKFPPRAGFEQAERILQKLPSPFFLWVHLFAPHYPYLPEPPYLHRFLPTDELLTDAEFADMVGLTGYHYSPDKQPVVDKGRLRYNEWIAQSDGAFGEFMAVLKRSGRFENTAVICSADHGESFRDGYLGHGGPQQLPQILRVPLIVHLPGQDFRHDVAASVDQTLLAPTLLRIAGIEPPEWMRGVSLQALVGGGREASGTSAFTQYFERNSTFKPLAHGTIGVIDGRDQFVFDLDSGRGELFDLGGPASRRCDRSAAEPALAMALRSRIYRQFPDIFGGRAENA
jgi:arylsulfatase A-like enzyme